jgi:hypothetical protein
MAPKSEANRIAEQRQALLGQYFLSEDPLFLADHTRSHFRTLPDVAAQAIPIICLPLTD